MSNRRQLLTTRLPFLPQDADSIKVLPYVEQQFAPELLAWLWKKMQDEYIPSHIWRDGIPLTLNEFIRFFSPLEGRGLFLAFYCPADGSSFSLDHIIGLLWIDQISTHKAHAHFFFFRQWWGGWTTAAAKKGLDLIFHDPFNLQLLLCHINAKNQMGKGFWRRVGVTMLGEIPHYYQHGDQFHSALSGYIDKDTYYGNQHTRI